MESTDVIVGLDCSGESYSAAVVRGEDCLAQSGGLSTRSHLRLLLPSLHTCLEQVGLAFKDISCVAVTNGPGSFTGLRLGVVTARTIAQVTKCKVVGVSTLEALALSVPGCECVLAGLDARRSEIFAAFFDTRGELPQRLTPDTAYSIEALVQAIQERHCHIAIGSCTDKYSEQLQALGSVRLMPKAMAQPQGVWVARLGREAYVKGLDSPIYELNPQYLRSAEVQVQNAVRS